MCDDYHLKHVENCMFCLQKAVFECAVVKKKEHKKS